MIQKTTALSSVVAFALSLGLWVASYAGLLICHEQGGGGGPGSNFRYDTTMFLFAVDGELACIKEDVQPASNGSGWSWRLGRSVLLQYHGFYHVYYDELVGGRVWPFWPPFSRPRSGPILALPLWLPAAVFAIPCVLFALVPVLRRAFRRWAGRCINCSYDLRGLQDNRCPECFEPFGTQDQSHRRTAIRKTTILLVVLVVFPVCVFAYRAASLEVRGHGWSLQQLEVEHRDCYVISDDQGLNYYEPLFDRIPETEYEALLHEVRSSRDPPTVSFAGSIVFGVQSICGFRVLRLYELDRDAQDRTHLISLTANHMSGR